MKQYFAYGSNMDEGQMTKRCPDAKLRDVVQLNNFEFFIDTRGVASIHEKGGGVVYGLRYDISDTDEANLDRYEGVPTHYIKVQIPQIESLCYVSTSERGDKPRVGYMKKIVEAAVVHQLPDKYIDELRSWIR